jgi:arylsulfatase A-like enzyme
MLRSLVHYAVFSLVFVQLSGAEESARKPNIIFILADDLGWRDVGYQSDGKFLTPNIDKLASEGMRFTSAYAAAGNCEPSRACLLSGMYGPRHGVYAVNSTDRGPKNLKRLIPIPNVDGLPGKFVTMAESLKSAGYATGHFGKWHLAGPDGELPSKQGFDVSFDSFGEGELKQGQEGNKTGPPEDPKGVYTLTHKAGEFIEANKDKPFFCYLAHHAIHTPLQMRPSTVKLVEDRAKAAGVSTKYMGCTYDLDDSIGMLLAKVKELDLEENTIIVFTSDNGGTEMSSQEPLRGNKGCYYDGGIREPMIVKWPGVVKPGGACDVPVISQDFYPTFLAAAHVETPADLTLDGESLLPLLSGSGLLKRNGIFWHFPGYLDRPVTRGRDPVFRTRPVTVMRSGDWKIHLYHEEWQLDGGREKIASNNSVEIYNMKNDSGEHHNLALTEPTMRNKLLDEVLGWMAKIHAPMPSVADMNYAPQDAKKSGKKKGRSISKASDEDS